MKKDFSLPIIMNSSTEEFTEICKQFLLRIDDYIQEAADKKRPDMVTYFEHSFQELEIIFKHVKKFSVTKDIRLHTRILLKDTEKVATVLNLKETA